MAQFPSPEVAQLSYDYRTLGLGFANLGSMLMVSGIPYDSEQARGIAGSITAIMTGVAYKTSAELASFLGAFDKYEENKEDMLRVMRNHRAAAYDAEGAYVGIEIKPQGIKAAYTPDYLLKAATKESVNLNNDPITSAIRNSPASIKLPGHTSAIPAAILTASLRTLISKCLAKISGFVCCLLSTSSKKRMLYMFSKG